MRLWTLHPKYLDAKGLVATWREALLAKRRGYSFDPRKLGRALDSEALLATTGQRDYEWRHFTAKLRDRDPSWLAQWSGVTKPELQPSFRLRPGPVASWERL